MSSTSNTTKRFVTLIDPAYKAGMLQIPIEKTSETKGRNEWLKGILRKDLSLCCLFQKGRCHADERCHQVHVDRVYMESLRAQLGKIVSCCSRCNDTASLTPAALNFFATNFGGSTKVCVSTIDSSDAINEIGQDRVAYTIGLVSFVEQARKPAQEGTVVLPGKKVCRLHLRAACKYGKDCKNIHLCSKLTESILAAPAKKIPTAQPATTKTAKPVNNGFAQRALPEPVCIATVVPSANNTQSKKIESTPAPSNPKPLPSFSMFSRPTPVSMEKGSLHLSCSQGQMDAVDVNENSGKLSGIIFDPKKALEESQKAGALRFDFNSTDAAWFGATSPGQKRRGSNSSNGTTASYDGSASLTNEWNPLSAGPMGNGQMDYLRIFS